MDYTKKSPEYIPSPHPSPQYSRSRSYSRSYAPASPIYSRSLSSLRDLTPPRRSRQYSPYQSEAQSRSQDYVPFSPVYRPTSVPSEYGSPKYRRTMSARFEQDYAGRSRSQDYLPLSPEYRPTSVPSENGSLGYRRTMSVRSEQDYAAILPQWNPWNEYPAGSEYAYPSLVNNNPSSPAAMSEYRSPVQEQAPQATGYGNDNSPVRSSYSGLDQDPVFNCGICLRVAAEEPVVTSCGHLYCWQCLYNWLHHLSNVNQECPICRGKVLEDMICPVYVYNSANNNVPPRPQGRRIEKD